jgi:alpha-ketoglutarate-dependent taurine dioxygenase
MSDSELGQNALGRALSGRRQSVNVAQEEMIRTGYLGPGKTLPLVIQPAVKDVELSAWVASNRDFVERELMKHGGILFRDFGVRVVADFERFTKAVSPELLQYQERSSPRRQVSGNIYTSTDHPADQSIFLHNENSYQQTWPLKIFFFCVKAAEQGGETPIADCRKIYERIRPELRERFAEKGWMVVRNFGDGLGLPWPTVFQTTDRAVVEEYCRKTGMGCEWKDGNRLRTTRHAPAAARHPRTGEMSWFNHATFFHVTTLEPSIQQVLRAEFKEEDLPTNTYYGDGSPIEDEVLDELREIYRQETVAFPWQEGDILILDNMLAAHGRAPYVGPRKVLVAMAEPFSRSEVEN